MTNYALLNNVEHKDVKIITERSAKYGDNVMYAITFPFEFRSVQAHYPILFHRDAEGNSFPVALFGFQEKENLFLDDKGWDASYVPAMIRRVPFLIGYQGSKEQEDEDKARVLSLDMDHPRVSRQEGVPLFQPLGGRTPYLDDMAALMENIYRGYVHNKTFTQALRKYNLTESVTMDITLKDGSTNQLIGFDMIDEDRIQRLSGDVLEELSKENLLMPLFMVLASTANIRSLIERKNRASGG